MTLAEWVHVWIILVYSNYLFFKNCMNLSIMFLIDDWSVKLARKNIFLIYQYVSLKNVLLQFQQQLE